MPRGKVIEVNELDVDAKRHPLGWITIVSHVDDEGPERKLARLLVVWIADLCSSCSQRKLFTRTRGVECVDKQGQDSTP